MRLSYFPRIYPDELLYSVVARWRRHLGWPTPSETARSLFGKAGRTRAIVDLPGQLGELVSRLPPALGHDAATLIDSHTLFPYVAAFLDQDRVEKTKTQMTGAGGKPHQHLGPRQKGIDFVTNLRVCAACTGEMTNAYGETYWKRSHQLPSSLVCDEHGDWLLSHTPIPTQVRPAYVPSPPHEELSGGQVYGLSVPLSHLIADLACLGRRLLDDKDRSVGRAIRTVLLETGESERQHSISQAIETLFPAFSAQGITLDPRALRTSFADHRIAQPPLYYLIGAACLPNAEELLKVMQQGRPGDSAPFPPSRAK